MGLENVKKEILDNARKQAKKITDEAEKERLEILKSVDNKVDEIKDQFERDSVKAIDQYKLMSMAESSSIVKKQKLNLEKDLIKEVFDETKTELKNSKGKKREQLLKKLLARTGFNYGKIYCAKQDTKVLKKHKADNVNIIGGVILENKDGNVRLDLGYETLLESIKQDYLSEIAKIMFG